MKVAYRVKPVTRFEVFRDHEGDNGSGSAIKGEYADEATAHEVAYALARDEHRRLGYPPGDDRIQYPCGQMEVTNVV